MTEKKQQKKGAASFWIPRKAIDALLKANATASEVAAYLILARHTTATGDHSTAAVKAVRTKAGMGIKPAQAAIDGLLQININGTRSKGPQSANAKQLTRLVYTADDWTKRTGEVLQHGPTIRSQVRYVINTFGATGKASDDGAVWFGGNLVSGAGTFERPMLALRQCGDRAAWLLLLLYANNTMDEWGGVSPVTCVFGRYTETHRQPIGRTPYTIAHWKLEHQTVWTRFANKIIDGLNGPHDELMQGVFWPAFNALVSHGFIYEVVTVATAQPKSEDPQEGDFPLYELDVRSLHGYKPEGEEGVGGETAIIARDLGYPVTDSEGHFFGKYAAVAPTGTPIRVVGVYRLRFRVANPKNATVADTWKEIIERHQAAKGWIADLRKRAHLTKPTPENQATEKHAKQYVPPPEADPWEKVFDMVREIAGPDFISLADQLKAVCEDEFEALVLVNSCYDRDDPLACITAALHELTTQQNDIVETLGMKLSWD